MGFRLAIAVACLVLCVPDHGAQAGPLHDAAKAGDVAQIELLLSQGTDINQSTGLATPLYYAIKGGHEEAARVLIERGADVNAPSIWGAPLHAAASHNLTSIVILLLDQRVDPNVRWKELTPLHFAAQNGRIESATILLDRGADINALSELDEPALHFAIVNGHTEVATLLRERGTKAPQAESIESLMASADPAQGLEVALPCRNCHSVDREGKTLNGPTLWGIVGRPRASVPGYRYSDALRGLGGAWTYAELNDYIAHPAWTVPGIAMKMGGIHDPKDRADIIAFLRTLSDDPVPLP
jgi:cytochrome c